MRFTFFIFLVVFLTNSCTKEESTLKNLDGMKPIYGVMDVSIIEAQDPRPLESGINLVLYNDLLLLVDEFKGIHILDNSNPANPTDIVFISVPGCIQATVSDDVLFVNFGSDLAMIDISELPMINIIDLVRNVYPDVENVLPNYPINYAGPFECVDPNKGDLVGWEFVTLKEALCSI